MKAYRGIFNLSVSRLVCAMIVALLHVSVGDHAFVRAQDENEYAVVITRVTTSMGDQGGGPEFFAKIQHTDISGWHKTTLVSGRNFRPPAFKQDCGHLCATHSYVPDWGIRGYVYPETYKDVRIRLTEEDKWANDDHVDIQRGSGRDLIISVGRYGGQPWVYFENQWHQCPRVSQDSYPRNVCNIVSKGEGGESATIRLSVQFPPAPAPI